jgi:hypothetical protein
MHNFSNLYKPGPEIKIQFKDQDTGKKEHKVVSDQIY